VCCQGVLFCPGRAPEQDRQAGRARPF
jgi:hypothetical protein